MLAKNNTESIATVSPRYVHINSMRLHEVLRDHGFTESGYTEARVRENKRGFQKHMSVFGRAGYQDAGGNFNLILINGHDGGTGLRFEMGYFRMVCENQLINSEMGFKVSHTGKALDKIDQGLPLLIKRFEEYRAIKERIESTELDNDQIKEFSLYALSLRGLDGAGSEKQELIKDWNTMRIGNARRSADIGNGAWEVLNRTQENLIRGTRNSLMIQKGEILTYRKLRATTQIDKIVSLNKALTSKMVELVTA